jgi:DNA-binding beta-propeller fold protein YncE
VFFYSPAASPEQGLVYLPGKGTLWALNAMIRQERDGKWSYASAAWEALIKPFIAKGEGESRSSSVSSTNTGSGKPQSRNPSAVSEITVDKWTRPQPGWLYILDPRTGPHSRVWLVDPETSKVMGSVGTCYDPDFALSRDGSHFYVVSGERESGELTVIDTPTGKLRHIPFVDRVLYKPWYQGLPPFSGMAVTPDSLTVWIPGQHVFSPDRIESRVWIFNTRGEIPLSRTVDLGTCGPLDFMPSSAANRYDVFCEGPSADSNRAHLVGLDQEYRKKSNRVTDLAWPKGCGALEEVFLLSHDNKKALIRSDGAIYETDPLLQNLSPTSVTGSCSEFRIARGEWPRSPDGSKVYLGYGGIAPDGMSAATELRVFDTTTWKELGRIQTSSPFWSAVASHDGKYVYAVAPAQHRVLVIDAVTLRERRAIEVGKVPSLALIAP